MKFNEKKTKKVTTEQKKDFVPFNFYKHNLKFFPEKSVFHCFAKEIKGLGKNWPKFLLIKFGYRNNPKLNTIVSNFQGMPLQFNNKGLKPTFGKKYLDVTKERAKQVFYNGSYKYLRLKQGLPSNGQRTRSNARNSRKLNPPRLVKHETKKQ